MRGFLLAVLCIVAIASFASRPVDTFAVTDHDGAGFAISDRWTAPAVLPVAVKPQAVKPVAAPRMRRECGPNGCRLVPVEGDSCATCEDCECSAGECGDGACGTRQRGHGSARRSGPVRRIIAARPLRRFLGRFCRRCR